MRARRQLLAASVLTAASLAAACAKPPAPVQEVVAVRTAVLPAAPDEAVWNAAPEHVAKMIPQDLVEPRLLAPSTAEVRIRALTNGETVAFRLNWADTTKSDTPGPAQMVDACAVQIPQQNGPQPPAPQMGEIGRPVDVVYWRADWQAIVNGRGDSIRDLYPNAYVDPYPFNARPLVPGSPEQADMARRYAPARALDNNRSGPRTAPVEELVAQGPGTSEPAAPRGSTGRGIWAAGSWMVVIARPWPQDVRDGQRTSVAFAVWQGSQHEAGARKMRTGWIPLLAGGAR
ncbi:MAG TPA: ethylbenzene dehydrogenase-related protein [Vicinamibacterales bacterium]|nr:ethylbenzene dehydrogenase-related protein [Vicinamibacterales bacterium]HPW19338.1 ethylbenzene dehydrogenase-related protein [Vicinamibacterales bacterium]